MMSWLLQFQVRHEQTTAFMASAYGKLTGKVASCLTVAGPGASNLATGLYDAKLDHAPVLALTGQVERQLIGPGTFQEIDQQGLFASICVFNSVIMTEKQTSRLVSLAVKHALVERGVSHLSIPKDIQKLPCDAPVMPIKGMIPDLNICPPDAIIAQAAAVIREARRPVIIAGFGTNGQGKSLLDLARKISAPVVTTFRGKGVIDEGNELCAGIHGDIGSIAAARLVRDSDLLIVIGCSLSNMTRIPPKRMVQVDIAPMMVAKDYAVQVGLWGNASVVLPKLIDAAAERRDEKYLEEISRLKKEWIAALEKQVDPAAVPLRPPYIIKVLNNSLPSNAVFALDVGENAWWFGRNFLMKDTQQMVMSGYLASMGFGLPGALAAQLAFPDRPVICITGDGGFTMVMGDFLTAVKYGLPVKVFLFNNRQLGMIMQEQRAEAYPNWQTELQDFSFGEYAKTCGGTGVRVNDPAELEAAVQLVLSRDGPAIVDINTDPVRFR